MRRTFPILFLLGLILALGRPAAAETGFLQKTIDYQGKPVKYVVYVPSTYDPSKPTPTILFLHGSGETGTDGWKQVAVGIGSAIMMNAERWNYLVLFPQKPPVQERGWIAFEPLIMDMLAKTKKEYNVDASRLYCTGLSMGGAGTWALTAKHPDLFAAVAPLCGGGPEDTASFKGIPVWAFYGDQDRAEGIQRCQTAVQSISAGGGNAKMTVYPGIGHNCWDKAYREEKLYEWFMQYQRK